MVYIVGGTMHLSSPQQAGSNAPKNMQPSISTNTLDSPLGVITLAASTSGLCGVWFEGQKHIPPLETQKNWTSEPNNRWIEHAKTQLRTYFLGKSILFDVPLDFSLGTAFQQEVWKVLLSIPAGKTQSYGQLAQQLGKPSAARAVGAAVGRNPMSIIVPCHRVLGSGGQLTGYAGGVWRKQALLKLEGHPAV